MTVDPAGSGAPMSERMQSLLSRAAEDQLAEQRQLAGALTDLRAQLQSIAADVGSLRDRSGDGGGSVEGALASVSADVREAVRLLGERLDGLARLVAQRGNDLAELNAASSELQAAVRGHGEALAGLGNGLGALPSFGERIGGLQNNLSALHERLASLDELTGTVGVLQQRVESVDHGLRELRSAFAAIGARMAELPGRGELDAAAGRSTTALDGLGERLDRLEEALRGVPEAVAARAPAPAPAQAVDLGPLQHELSRVASAHAETAAGTHERLSALEARTAEVLAALTPEEEDTDEDELGDEVEVEDPVATELAELREALLGEGGIAERLEAAGEQDLDEKVATAVQRAVAASEERLSAHFDEAVLALAEALLRRRTGRSATPRPTPVAAEPAAQAGHPDPVETVPPVAADESEPVADEDTDDERSASAPWQTPPEPTSEAQPDAQPERSEDTEHRRRPWWRPGD